MIFASLHNKHLIVRPGVVLTEMIDRAISALDEWFDGTLAYVTSGLRTKEDQLVIIRRYAQQTGVHREFPAILTASVDARLMYKDKSMYAWRPAWSRLLERGIIINPPIAAAPLFDYWKGGKNLKGVTIMPSPHFRGTAFDIGGGADGVDEEAAILSEAIKEVKLIRSFLVERQNNCLHVDCVTKLEEP